MIKLVHVGEYGSCVYTISEKVFKERLESEGLSYRVCDGQFVVSANISISKGEGNRLIDTLKKTRDKAIKEESLLNKKCKEYKKILFNNVGFITDKIYEYLKIQVRDVENPVPATYFMLNKYIEKPGNIDYSITRKNQIIRLVDDGFLSNVTEGEEMFQKLDKSDLYYVVIDNVEYFVYKEDLLRRLEEEGLTYKSDSYVDGIRFTVSLNLEEHVLKL